MRTGSTTKRPPTEAGLLLKLSQDAVAVLNVLGLRRIEIIEKLRCFARVVTAAGKVRDPLLLLCDVSDALGDMTLGFFQMTKLHRPVHPATMHPVQCTDLI